MRGAWTLVGVQSRGGDRQSRPADCVVIGIVCWILDRLADLIPRPGSHPRKRKRQSSQNLQSYQSAGRLAPLVRLDLGGQRPQERECRDPEGRTDPQGQAQWRGGPILTAVQLTFELVGPASRTGEAPVDVGYYLAMHRPPR